VSHRRQGTLRTVRGRLGPVGVTIVSVCYMLCAVMLAFASLSTDFPCELVHNFVLINVFCFDFGSFLSFIMLNRV